MIKCNRCSNTINTNDSDPLIINYHFGYGSRHDLDRLKATLCCACADEVTERLIDECVINPLTEYDPRMNDIIDLYAAQLKIVSER